MEEIKRIKFNIVQVMLNSDLKVNKIPEGFPQQLHLVTDRGEIIPVKVDYDMIEPLEV